MLLTTNCEIKAYPIVGESMNKKAVELHEVETIYEGERFPAIKGISLEINEGEFLSHNWTERVW